MRCGGSNEGGEKMNNLSAMACKTVPVTIPPDGVAQYLLGLSRLCAEVARNPKLLPSFMRVLRLVPSTLAALQRAQRRLAA
jgi:hypothetical protein